MSEPIGITFDLVRKFCKWIVYVLLGMFACMLVLWFYVFATSYIAVSDRLYDLVYVVSEENCLSNDAGANGSMAHYEKLLQQTENVFLKFTVSSEAPTNFTDNAFDTKSIAYYVGEITPNMSTNGKNYYNYVSAPQRGSGIEVRVKGIVRLPIFFRSENGTFASFIAI